MIKVEAKPCPLCGSDINIEITEESSFYKAQGRYGNAAIYIQCSLCNLQLWDHTTRIKNYEERKEILLAKWNERSVENGNYLHGKRTV